MAKEKLSLGIDFWGDIQQDYFFQADSVLVQFETAKYLLSFYNSDLVRQNSLRFFSLIHSSLKVDMTNLLLPYRVVSSITSCKSISDTGVDYYLFVVKNAS